MRKAKSDRVWRHEQLMSAYNKLDFRGQSLTILYARKMLELQHLEEMTRKDNLPPPETE